MCAKWSARRCRTDLRNKIRTINFTQAKQRNFMKRVSLTQYLVEEQRLHNSIPAELRLLIEVVARACKTISHSVGKGALGEVLGTADTENIQGEVQKKLDII